MMGIYAYVDTMNNSVVYVGKDSHIEYKMRHKYHMQPCVYNAQKINQILQNNPNRYEYKEIFVFDEISQTELNNLEMQQIALFNPKFNFTNGGEGLYGFKHSEETKEKLRELNRSTHRKHTLKDKIKMSKMRNTCGYYRVSKIKNPKYKQGFLWRYGYRENQKRKFIYSTDLEVLKQKVKAKGLEWYKLEEVEDE